MGGSSTNITSPVLFSVAIFTLLVEIVLFFLVLAAPNTKPSTTTILAGDTRARITGHSQRFLLWTLFGAIVITALGLTAFFVDDSKEAALAVAIVPFLVLFGAALLIGCATFFYRRSTFELLTSQTMVDQRAGPFRLLPPLTYPQQQAQILIPVAASPGVEVISTGGPIALTSPFSQ
jgi:hypothetical protein